MINDILQDASGHMTKSIEALKRDFAKVRTGRAHPSLLSHIVISYYGNDAPLQQVANVSVEDARTLTITPWEKPMVQAIEKAIMSSGLGLNPVTSGSVIRVPLPPLTEERRRDLVKVVRQEAEQGKISIRNARRDANSELKEALKEKMISEDEERQGEDKVQKLTDQFIQQVEKLLEEKEADLLSV